DNIQLGWKGGQKARFVSEFVVERQSSGARVTKALGELAARDQREEFLRCPERNRRRSWSRTFQANLTKMEFRRAEISVRRRMFIEAAHCRITKEDAAAAIGLQPVFVRIYHQAVNLA